jgi:LuxR family transcriptional regulator, maltose regulon positive regulatory protein
MSRRHAVRRNRAHHAASSREAHHGAATRYVSASRVVRGAAVTEQSAGRERAARARLEDNERDLLGRLTSALSIDQIARDLRIPPTEASTRVHAIYRKLGVSSRRTAVCVAHEEGLLR